MGLRSKAIFLLRQFPFVYPRAIINSCQDWIEKQGKQKGIYFSQRGPWYKNIFLEEFINNGPPQTIGQPNEKAFYNNRSYRTSKASLFYLQNCYLFGHKGLVLSNRHEVFQEFSHHFSISTLKKFLWGNPLYLFTKSAKKVTGIGAVLISPESNNYYHWLYDVLPRLRLYQEVIDQIDHFCIASNVPQKFMETLKAFNIAPGKILLVNEKEKLHFDYLYVSSLTGSEGRSPVWAVKYLREKFILQPVKAPPFKKLYFKRGNAVERRIINEPELIVLLQKEDFEIVDPGTMGINEQLSLVQQAGVIVAAHGAALSNLLFSHPGTTVIELFSPDYFRTDCYYTLSAILNLNYWYLTGEKPAGAKWGDIIINEELLKNTLGKIKQDTTFVKN